MSANQMVGTDSGYIEKSITQFRKGQKRLNILWDREVDMPENSKYYPKVGK